MFYISNNCYCALEVFSVDIRIRFISKQSSISDLLSDAFKYSDSVINLNQYSVSAVSFNAICNFAIKSALLAPYVASFMFAQILVPLRIICFDITVSCFYLHRYLCSLTILAAKNSDFSCNILSCAIATSIKLIDKK